VNYRDALAWLYATQRFGIKLGLENIERLLRSLGLADLQTPRSARASRAISGASLKSLSSYHIIHVAGTNGKGSVCAMIDAISRAASHRTGLFTSPHLISFRERIRVNGEMISEGDIACGLTEIRELVSGWEPHPTFFEIVTALGLQHFQKACCQVVVLETGMGGRLDATNAVASNTSVITPIDFDHEKWLGHSIAEIAREKAGIIKPGVSVVSAPQREEAEMIITQRARECGAPLQFVSEPWTNTKISLAGQHQKMNAAVAVASLRATAISIPEDAIARGLESVEWPARFQTWNKQTVIDGAHNPAAAKILAQTWHEQFGDDRATILLAILRDKNVAEIVQALAPIATKFVLPQIRSERALPPVELVQVISSINPPLPCSISASVADALEIAREEKNRILITGSLHFAGEALAILRGEPNALEECAE
jgi:dihydrofolate synthase / folylpolyglutamate synthase